MSAITDNASSKLLEIFNLTGAQLENLPNAIEDNYEDVEKVALEHYDKLFKSYNDLNAETDARLVKAIITRYCDVIRNPSFPIDDKIQKKYLFLENSFNKFLAYLGVNRKLQREKNIHQLNAKKSNQYIFTAISAALLGKITGISLYKFGFIALVFTILNKIKMYWEGKTLNSKQFDVMWSSRPDAVAYIKDQLKQIDCAEESKTQ